MLTQLESARKGLITDEMKQAAEADQVQPEDLRRGIAEGHIVLLKNARHPNANPVAVGAGVRTKVNANIGSSKDHADPVLECTKARTAREAGTDTFMDLSTGGDVDAIRKQVMEAAPIPIGTVPFYQAAIETVREGRPLVEMEEENLFRVIEKHVQEGVDFLTVHCGVTLASRERMEREGRRMDVVSRGGSFHLGWMAYHGRENPLFEHFDRLLEIAHSCDATLSLGDGFRPGCLADASDRAQIQELILIGELAGRARDAGVQVMIEGPGHVPLDQVAMNVALQKKLCNGAPFYVLGPIVTDIAPGYDHITSAIGGALAAAAGADFLCYVTPSEHLRLPSPEDVWEGVMASRIAAHAADIAKGIPHAVQWDQRMADYRKKLDWEGQIREAIDPDRAKKMRESSRPQDEEVCTMCAEFCAIKTMREARAK